MNCKFQTQNGELCSLAIVGCSDYCAEHNKNKIKKQFESFYRDLRGGSGGVEATSISVPHAISAETLRKLFLQSGKYEYITLEHLTDFTFARVGVPTGLFHCVAFLQFYDDYQASTNKELFAETMKDNFFKQISSQEWVKNITEQQYVVVLNKIIENMNQYLQTQLSGGWFSWLFGTDYTFQITELIDSLIQPNVSFSEFCQSLQRVATHAFGVNEEKIKIIIGESVEQAYTVYKNHVECAVGFDELRMIAGVFGINIFAFGVDGVLFKDNCTEYNSTFPSILLYNQGNSHWEPIVQIESNSNQILEQPPDSVLTRTIMSVYKC